MSRHHTRIQINSHTRPIPIHQLQQPRGAGGGGHARYFGGHPPGPVLSVEGTEVSRLVGTGGEALYLYLTEWVDASDRAPPHPN